MSSNTGGLALPVTDPALAQRLNARLADVETALAAHVRGSAPFVSEAAALERAACVVELTHLASLYHDDVMDEALLRRGADSANARWDNLVAILTGDFLFARSSELTADLGPEAVRIQAQTFARLVEGQILETVPPGDDVDPVEHHLAVVAGKTGSLIATSARYGAMFAGASAEVVEALTAYGEIVGTAFQLSDDILDIASDSTESGKTPGTDLKEGVPTLPVLLVARSTDPADARLQELLDPRRTDLAADDVLHAEALGLLRAHPALTEAREYVVARATEAKERLAVLPAGPVRDALEAFADVVATRTA